MKSYTKKGEQMMDIVKTADLSKEVLEFLDKKKMKPHEKIVALKSAAAIIENVLTVEMTIEMSKQALLKIMRDH